MNAPAELPTEEARRHRGRETLLGDAEMATMYDITQRYEELLAEALRLGVAHGSDGRVRSLPALTAAVTAARAQEQATEGDAP